MKQYTTTFGGMTELQQWLAEIEIVNSSSVLVQIFSGLFSQDELLKDILKTIKNALPKVTIIGTSTAGEIIEDQMQDFSIVISVSVFNSTQLKSFSVISEDSREMGKEIVEHIVGNDTKALIIFADGLSCNGDALLRGVSDNITNPDVVVAGGLAGDNNSFNYTYLIEDEMIFSQGAVAVALSGEDLSAYTSYNLSWKPIGSAMKVTKADGNKIYEIDSQPVAKLYRDFLGDDIADKMPDSAIEFPLIFEKKGVLVARSMIAATDEYIVYAGEIPQDADVRFGIASATMFQAARNEVYKVNAALPVESMYVYSCVARKAFLGKEIEREIKPLNDIAPISGFFTYGELYTENKDYKMLNITTTVLALSETKKTDYEYKNSVIDEKRLSLSTTALIHLVNKTVSNLEEESLAKQNTIAQLNQYQKAIYRSYIVSMTDINGKIIDVNDNFIKISGYSREELIGRSHNIVRHPDMPDTFFKNLWETIQNKKIWQGTLKNLHKSGTTYHVNATVFPILDKDGNITKYVSIRDDITHINVEKERAEAIFNAQNSIVLLTLKGSDAFEVKQLNQKFFDLFDYKNTDDFLKHYSCICDLFIAKEGYLQKDMDGKSWLEYALQNPEHSNLVLMRDKYNNTRIFSLRVQNVNLENGEFVISTFTDVSELENARLEAQAAEKTKSAFLSTMSHELRTPLNAVIGFSQILMQKKEMPEEQKLSFIEKINISGTHLLELVNNILDYSKMESENMQLHQKECDLQKIIKESVTLLEVPAANKGVSIDTKNFEGHTVLGDEQLLKQLVLNLLTNAVKFTPKGKNILIDYSADKNFQVISICDEGHGIPQNSLKNIFEPFSQVQEHQHEAIKGTGLGLAICKKIVELHHGKIEVESVLERGTCFRIYIPKKGK